MDPKSEDNDAPVITSPLKVTATVGVPWEYRIEATDPEGQVLRYDLAEQYNGPSLDYYTGIMQFTPTEDQAGTSFNLQISVTDGIQTTTEDVEVTVLPANQANRPPAVTSTPPNGTVAPGAAWVYAAKASDPDYDPLRFSLVSAPATWW